MLVQRKMKRGSALKKPKLRIKNKFHLYIYSFIVISAGIFLVQILIFLINCLFGKTEIQNILELFPFAFIISPVIGLFVALIFFAIIHINR